MIWIQYAPALLVAFLVVLIAVLPLASLGGKFGWVYEHKRAARHVVMPPVPYVGGIALVIGLLASALIIRWPPETLGLAVGMVMAFALGVIEDRKSMRKRFWFAGMIAAAAAAVIGGQHLITSTGPVFGFFEIPFSILSLPVTVAFVGVIAVGFRLLDRADGLCDGQALISTLALVVVAAILSFQGSLAWPLPGFAVVSLSLIGALLGLSFYTFRRPGRRLAAVYLGSAGAMVLGLVVGWLGLQVHAGFGEDGIGLGGLLWLVAIPVTDMLFYGLRRLMAGRNWTEQDKFRVYHWLKEQQFTVGQAVMITHGASLVIALVAIVGWQVGLPDFFLFWGFWVGFAAYALAGLGFWTKQNTNRPQATGWKTAQAAEQDQLIIDVEAHTVLGDLGEESSIPFRTRPGPGASK